MKKQAAKGYDSSDRPALLTDVEAMIAAWDRDGEETYRELALKIVASLREKGLGDGQGV